MGLEVRVGADKRRRQQGNGVREVKPQQNSTWPASDKERGCAPGKVVGVGYREDPIQLWSEHGWRLF
jgi:hypothetical protein